jgi:hypothetical protein
MNQARIQLNHGHENEPSLMHQRVGDPQIVLFYHLIPIEEDIEIDDAGFPFLPSDPPHLRLDGQKGPQQLSRPERRFDTNNPIYVPFLRYRSYRLRPKKIGSIRDPASVDMIHQINGFKAIAQWSSYIRTDPDIGGHHGE